MKIFLQNSIKIVNIKSFFLQRFFFTVFCYFSSSAALRLPTIHLYLSIACKKASSVHLAKYKNASCHPHFYTDCIIYSTTFFFCLHIAHFYYSFIFYFHCLTFSLHLTHSPFSSVYLLRISRFSPATQLSH